MTASSLDFKKLFLKEQELLDPESTGDESDLETEQPGPAGEPFFPQTNQTGGPTFKALLGTFIW
jgi:hypothetical protein